VRRFVFVVGLCACSVHQAHIAKRAGEITAGAALVAMLATIAVAAAHPGADTELLEFGAVFVPITIGGAAVYVAADSIEPTPVAAPEHSSSWTAAMDLAKQAKHAARRGDCAEVQAIEPRVRDLDDDVYRRFLSDKIIRACLPAAQP
jgi:hypothetical protein